MTVLELSGRLTVEPFGYLKTRVRHRVDQGRRCLVLDLSGVSYVDSIGVAELIRSHIIVTRGGGRLALAAIPDHLGQLLRMTRLDRLLERHDTGAEAVHAVTEAGV